MAPGRHQRLPEAEVANVPLGLTTVSLARPLENSGALAAELATRGAGLYAVELGVDPATPPGSLMWRVHTVLGSPWWGATQPGNDAAGTRRLSAARCPFPIAGRGLL